MGRDGGRCSPGWGALRGHKEGCTFRSLLSSRINSEPWMSCRTKMSLYSPKPSASSQAATSSEPHLSASREENQSGGWGPTEAAGHDGAGSGQRWQQASPLPAPALAGPEATAGSGWRGCSSPQLTYGASELLPPRQDPKPWGRDLPEGLSCTIAPFSPLQWWWSYRAGGLRVSVSREIKL